MADTTYQIDVKMLAKEIGLFDGIVKDKCRDIQGKLTVDTLKALITASPFETGELRSGWVASTGTPSSFIPPKRVALKGERRGMHGPEGRAAVVDAKSIATELKTKPFGTKSFIVNNVRYVNYVNDGIHGNAHNAGFIEAAVENAYSKFLS